LGGVAFAQPGPLQTLRNSNLVFSATVLTSNGVPGLAASPSKLMISEVQTNSAQGGKVVLTVAAWGKSYNGPGNYWDLPARMIVDDAGSVIVTGWTYGAGTIDDFTTIKYSAGGAGLWTNRFDGVAHGSDKARYVAVDGANNVYVTGESANSGGGSDVITIRYAADGTALWTNQFNWPTALA